MTDASQTGVLYHHFQTLAAAQKLRAHWGDFCDADPTPEGFAEEMEAAGFIEVDAVTEDDLESPFAAERGIEPGGSIWRLTASGRASLAAQAVSR